MATGFLPETDSGLLSFSYNFATILVANPVSLGLTAAAASAYQAKQVAYDDALQTATDPNTRGGATIFAKNTAKDALIADTRAVARIIQNNPAVTDQQRYDLGLTIRKTTPTPKPAPTTSPKVEVLSTMGHVVTVRLSDAASTTKRGRPANVDGATVMAFVGDAPSANVNDWTFMGNFAKTVCDLTFDASVPNGATIWVSAFWIGSKMNSGPASTPVPCNLPGSMASSTVSRSMKIAA